MGFGSVGPPKSHQRTAMSITAALGVLASAHIGDEDLVLERVVHAHAAQMILNSMRLRCSTSRIMIIIAPIAQYRVLSKYCIAAIFAINVKSAARGDEMEYIRRDAEREFLSLCEEYPVVLVTGMRQAGKSTMLEHFLDEQRKHVTLDDLQERALAQEDPELFLQSHEPPVMIDEVQYAPELFPYLKIWADRHPDAMGDVWLTGSQPFSLMRLAGESLSGRVGITHLLPLSQHELFGQGELEPLAVDLGAMRDRSANRAPATLPEMNERIYRGSMPAVASGRHKDPARFYRSYQQTYIERDVRGLDQAADMVEFSRFMAAVASQVGQTLNIESLARDVGIPRRKAQSWLAVLELSDIVFLLQPYSNNALARTIKTPKLFFNDTGLAAWLGRWTSPESIGAGAMGGALFENYVVSEVRKTIVNSGDPAALWYYRDRDAKEIDIVLECDGMLHPLEVKRSANPQASAARAFPILDRSTLRRGAGAIICMKQDVGALPGGTLYVPAWAI